MQLGVTMRLNDGTLWSGHILDICGNAVHAAGASPPSTGAEGEICISLGGAAGLASIFAVGRVGRASESEAVLHFNELLGPESAEHLRQLILANADDPTAVESEFAAHIGLKKRFTNLSGPKGGHA